MADQLLMKFRQYARAYTRLKISIITQETYAWDPKASLSFKVSNQVSDAIDYQYRALVMEEANIPLTMTTIDGGTQFSTSDAISYRLASYVREVENAGESSSRPCWFYFKLNGISLPDRMACWAPEASWGTPNMLIAGKSGVVDTTSATYPKELSFRVSAPTSENNLCIQILPPVVQVYNYSDGIIDLTPDRIQTIQSASIAVWPNGSAIFDLSQNGVGVGLELKSAQFPLYITSPNRVWVNDTYMVAPNSKTRIPGIYYMNKIVINQR